MNNNQTDSPSGCIGMIVVIALLWMIFQNIIGVVIVVGIVILIIVLIAEAGGKHYYAESMHKKLDYLDSYYKDVDESVTSKKMYIEDKSIVDASIDERIAYLKCICKEVKNIQKED